MACTFFRAYAEQSEKWQSESCDNNIDPSDQADDLPCSILTITAGNCGISITEESWNAIFRHLENIF